MANDLRNRVLLDLVNLRDTIIARSIAAGQLASGRTYDNMVIVDSSTMGRIHIDLEAPNYIEVLQRGRAPGKVPYNFEDIILQWLIDKGIQPEYGSLESLAANIAWGIKRYGTKLYATNTELDIFNSVIEEFIKNLTEEIVNYYADSVSSNIFASISELKKL